MQQILDHPVNMARTTTENRTQPEVAQIDIFGKPLPHLIAEHLQQPVTVAEVVPVCPNGDHRHQVLKTQGTWSTQIQPQTDAGN